MTPGIRAVQGAASVFSASSCNAVISATALVHGAAAAVIAFAVSAMCRSGHITCSVDISSVSQRVGSGVGWDIVAPRQPGRFPILLRHPGLRIAARPGFPLNERR